MTNRFWAIRRIDRNYIEPTLYKRVEAARAAVSRRRGYEIVPLTADDRKLVWQVRDTCARAEAAEANLAKAVEAHEKLRDAAEAAVIAMARAFERLHSLPRVTDSELADRVVRSKEELRKALRAVQAQGEAQDG